MLPSEVQAVHNSVVVLPQSLQKNVLYSRRSDRSVSLLSSCVPDLSLDSFALDLDAACGKLYPDRALAFQVELIPCKAG